MSDVTDNLDAGMGKLAGRIDEALRKVAAGEIDLRPINEALFGKWDQDYIAETLRLARRPPDVAVLRETDELVEKVARGIAVYDANNPHGSLEGRARAAIRAMLSSAPSAVDRAYTEGSEGRSVK